MKGGLEGLLADGNRLAPFLQDAFNSTLEAAQEQILSQSLLDATSGR